MSTVNRIDQCFSQLKEQERRALIPFVTAGDPEPEWMVSMMHALVDAGANIIELGVPFSDPMADGPTIQHAHERALAKGVDLAKVLSFVREFRQKDNDTPVVLMGYLNPVEIYGYAAFGRDAVAAGVDGVLLVDCPVEERATVEPLRQAGLEQIYLCAPTTSHERLPELCREAKGFLYYVSVAGITGTHALSADSLAERVSSIRAQASVPVAVGFGIRNAEQARTIAHFADAVVIGSALVEAISDAQGEKALLSRVHHFLAPIRQGLDQQED